MAYREYRENNRKFIKKHGANEKLNEILQILQILKIPEISKTPKNSKYFQQNIPGKISGLGRGKILQIELKSNKWEAHSP